MELFGPIHFDFASLRLLIYMSREEYCVIKECKAGARVEVLTGVDMDTYGILQSGFSLEISSITATTVVVVAAV